MHVLLGRATPHTAGRLSPAEAEAEAEAEWAEHYKMALGGTTAATVFPVDNCTTSTSTSTSTSAALIVGSEMTPTKSSGIASSVNQPNIAPNQMHTPAAVPNQVSHTPSSSIPSSSIPSSSIPSSSKHIEKVFFLDAALCCTASVQHCAALR